ncbi:Fc.00g071970.m01.CDS01 [Cosmosporella sp. VM-42]
MPAFQAINLEPEENIDEQIDTTKEIHVDEALKRFQTALKLHAQGPRFRDDAAKAYEDLFLSEIFKYREAQTDYARAERHADGQPEPSELESFSAGLDVDAGGADGVAASLSQALYLSYKNLGQFFLDKLKDKHDTNPDWKAKPRVDYYADEGLKVLDSWTAALDQDPSDPELWRRAARFAGSMNSARIKRYCLEAAVELDDDPTVAEVEPPSLAEGFAGEQLKEQLQVLGDDMALSHPVMAPWVKKEMPALLKRHLDPISFLPDPTRTLTPPPSPQPGQSDLGKPDAGTVQPRGRRASIKPISSWPSLGEELMSCFENTDAAFEACKTVVLNSQEDVDMEAPNNEGQETSQDPEDQPKMVPEPEVTIDTECNEKKVNPTEKEAPATAVEEDPKSSEQPQKERSVSIPTRKRSQSTAGLPDGADEENGAEKRSKRVRRRDTGHDEGNDPSTLVASQLQPYQGADQNLFQMTKSILENLGVEDKSTLGYINELLDSCAAEDRLSKMTRLAATDLRGVVTKFSEDTARALLNKNEQPTLGLSSFLEHAKTGSQDQSSIAPFDEAHGLKAFAEKMDHCRSWMTGEDIAFEWVRAISASYATSKWSEKMKVSVVHMLNRVDSALYTRITDEMDVAAGSPERLAELENIIPMLFELHIDIYERITNPSSVVDYATRMETKYRLGRWLDTASAYVQLRNGSSNEPLSARFLWAAVWASSFADNAVREHILLMWTSLRDFLAEEGIETINLPNNNIMPTISPAAADREISRLTTMDFFLSLFQDDHMENPVHVIETLEPVLNPSSVYAPVQGSESPMNRSESPTSTESRSSSKESQKKKPISNCASQGLRDLWKFLQNSGTEMRLFLWSRLGDAYDAIKYTTKKFSCQLKSIEMIMFDIENETYSKTPEESRKLLFMRTLKSLDELLIQALSSALNDSTAFDIIDEDHIKQSSAAIAKVSCLLHVASLCEDEIRIGITIAPTLNSANNATYKSLRNKLQEMQVRAWCLQYTILKAAITQQNAIIAPENDMADYLAAVHQVIGLRRCCKCSNKIFLKMMRMELLKLQNIENWEDYLGQVLYDLHGLKLGAGVWDVQDHGCPPEKLEKRQTMQLVERITILANRMPMKDLLKSDLKTTIEHMQQTVGQTKSNPQMIHNLRNFTEYLKKPIHPLRLYQALLGGVSVDAVSVNTPETALARHGWFFLLGMIALTKFKGVDLNRRQTPGATDDLRIGATFLRLQLQFTADRWDAWFRLAECFDYELDEAVLWTADKMNKDRGELVKFQRNAIHCYTLALSHSRNMEVDTHDGDPLHDLYHKFGMRLYASSREPFAMEPFQHSEQERYFIESMGAGTFKRILHEQMTVYKAWKFSAKLFRMAIVRKPDNWKNHYMLAKCYWKMYQASDDVLDSKDKQSRISRETVLDTLKTSLEVAYNARKSRSSDPILEPHYKLVSILHKLVMRGDIPSSEAATILSEQPFGIPINPDDLFASFSEPEDWEEYVIRNLGKLREKDKSNWHHRIIMRHAKILFNETSSQINDLASRDVATRAAFAILRESMFTKTMVMNVWKCDFERPGRHHVYTEQYVRFMTKLLVLMSDRTNLELLLRRLRKKGADFYHFTDLWHSCCMEYLHLVRQSYKVPQVTDDVFKALSNEEFEIMSERITEWAASEGAQIPVFNCMRDTVELKKLNANLMKAAPIDDLLNDCYSKIYLEVAKTLPGPEPSKVIEERNHAKEVAAQLEAAALEAKAANSLSSILNPPNGQTSLPGTLTPLDTEKPEAAPRARRAGVRRPEVLRKAEQAVVRSMEAPKTSKSRVGSISSGKNGSNTPNAAASDAGSDAGSDDEGPDAQVRREAGEDVDEEMKDAEAHDDAVEDETMGDAKTAEKEEVESEPGSIHDSADDESDLSDVPEDYDEEPPPGLLFPNLARATESSRSSGEDADSESEGDDEAEESDGEEEAEEVAEEAAEEDEEDEEGHENEDTEMAEHDDEDNATEKTPDPEL